MSIKSVIMDWARRLGLAPQPEPTAPAPIPMPVPAPARASGMGMGRMGSGAPPVAAPPSMRPGAYGSYASGNDVLWMSTFPELGAWTSPLRLGAFASWGESQIGTLAEGVTAQFVGKDGFTVSFEHWGKNYGEAIVPSPNGESERFEIHFRPELHRAFMKCDSGIVEIDTLKGSNRLIPRSAESARRIRGAYKSAPAPRPSRYGNDDSYAYSTSNDGDSVLMRALIWSLTHPNPDHGLPPFESGRGGDFGGGGATGSWDAPETRPAQAGGQPSYQFGGERVISDTPLTPAPMSSIAPEFDLGSSGSKGWDAAAPALDAGPDGNSNSWGDKAPTLDVAPAASSDQWDAPSSSDNAPAPEPISSPSPSDSQSLSTAY